jgi:phage terminase large subunit-like protein
VRGGKASLIDWDAKFLNVQAGMSQRADGWAGAEVWDRGIDKTLTLDALLDRSEVVTIGSTAAAMTTCSASASSAARRDQALARLGARASSRPRHRSPQGQHHDIDRFEKEGRR